MMFVYAYEKWGTDVMRFIYLYVQVAFEMARPVQPMRLHTIAGAEALLHNS
jgi:hypothetical protein